MDQNTASIRARRRVEQTRSRNIQERLARDFKGTMRSIDKALGKGRRVIPKIPLPVPHTTFEDDQVNRMVNVRLMQLHQTQGDLAYNARERREGKREQSDPIGDVLKKNLEADLPATLSSMDLGHYSSRGNYEQMHMGTRRRKRRR